MPVRIRLALHGCKNRPFYHIVVAPARTKRGGRHLEQVGSYDPMPNYNNEVLVSLHVDRIKYWLSVGAEPTIAIYRLFGLAGTLPVHPRLYLEARRKRAARAAQQPSEDQTTEPSAPEVESSKGQS